MSGWIPDPSDVDSLNILGWYRKGWTTGAKIGTIPKEFENHPNPAAHEHFSRGWTDGRAAFHAALLAERERLGLPPPNPLRMLSNGSDQPSDP
jgi:hypothetical protein